MFDPLFGMQRRLFGEMEILKMNNFKIYYGSPVFGELIVKPHCVRLSARKKNGKPVWLQCHLRILGAFLVDRVVSGGEPHTSCDDSL